MHGAHLLIRSEGLPSLSARAQGANRAAELDPLVSELLGRGFVASVACAALAAAALLLHSTLRGGADGLAAGAALLLAALVALVHAGAEAGSAGAAEGGARDAAHTIWRHRVVLLVLGIGVAWASQLWVHQSSERSTLATVLLVLMAGIGATAAAADRPSLSLWLTTVAGLPGVAALALGGAELRIHGLLLLTLAVVVLGLAGRVRRLVLRAWRVKQENDQLVAQLRQQVALVELADQEKSRFLGAASHDLRQPMHALGLFAAALEKELRATAHHPKVISMARAVDALEDSFSAMLDVSKLDAGIVSPNLQSFPIRDVFRRLHMHCAGQAEERGLSLRFKPGGKLVTSDAQLLERILGNLIHNAIRCTREGGVVVVVRTRRSRTSIEVWDTGVGIAEDELPKIFNEFYQIENKGRDRSKGLGMGLSIVKRLVVLLGYELEVDSTPGRGTVFRLLMPPTDLAEMQSMVLGADTIPQAPDEDRTVLVIDDELAVRDGMRALLEGWGYSVLLAATIAEARTAVSQHAGVIDIVVSDLRLGDGEDGQQAIADVRQQYGAPLPAILITGDTSPEQVRRVHEGGHPVLFKPVRARDLYAALRAIP